MERLPSTESEAVAKQLVKLIEVPKMNVQRVLDFISANPDALFTIYKYDEIPGPTPTIVYKLPLASLLSKKLSREMFARIFSLNPRMLREPDDYGLLHLHHSIINYATSEVIMALIDVAPDTAATPVIETSTTKYLGADLANKTPLELAQKYGASKVVIDRINQALASSNAGRASTAAARAAANAVAAALLEEESAAAAAVSAKAAAKAAARAAKAAAKKPAAAAATAAAAPAPNPVNLLTNETAMNLPLNSELLREYNLKQFRNTNSRFKNTFKGGRRRRHRSTYRSRKH